MATITVTPIKTFVSGETVTPTKLNELSQSTVALTAGTIVAADLASDAVTTAKILDANVTTAKILDANMTTAKIADSAVTQAKLASNVATTGPAFRAYATASTTGLNNGVAKRVDLAAEDFDTASCFASSRFTPNVAGYYLISAAVRFEALANCSALVVKNGTIRSIGSTPNAGTYHTVVTDLVYLNGTTDWVELHAIQYTGNNQSTGIANSEGTWMSGFLARAA
jgi:hypothetical protein